MLVSTKVPELFTTQDALASGLTRKRLDAMVANREIIRVLWGVYRRADVEDSVVTRARAAALVVTPSSVLTDRTAAWIHGVDTFDYRELELLPPLEVFVLRGCSRIERRGCVGGERDLFSYDICVIGGVRVTTPSRTAMDLGCRLSRSDGLAALDGFMRLFGLGHDDFYAELPRYRRRRGVVQLRQLVPLADPRAESPGESWVRLAIVDGGIPLPQPQFWVEDESGEPLFRVDLAYPLNKVCVEYDGREFHTSGEDRAYDARRRRWLVDHGWTVIVVTKDDFAFERLVAWRGELRRALGIAV
jgi:hypothetical protein